MFSAQVGLFAAGVVSWTFAEYWLHRLLGHIPGSKNLFTREHMAHHGIAGYFGPWWLKITSAFITTTLITLLLSRFLLPPLSLSFALGFGAAYLAYEAFHRSIHTRPPRTRLGAQLRKHHLQHHFQSAKRNLGVSNRLWDRIFGTAVSSDRLRVPIKLVPQWLIDESTGGVKGDFQGDYSVHGRLEKSPSDVIHEGN